uniref:Hydrin 2 n=1 Tax=Aquarana catesbeiana TaxID=8400 RepID=Q7LZD3_AQUCT|nr:hydrin 2 [Pelophylax lessonae]
CYIQNCPRGG